MLIGPNLIHLMLPFTLVPTSGINKTANKIILININIQSVLYKNSDGIDTKKIKAKRPIAINKACLSTKWNGFFVISSAM